MNKFEPQSESIRARNELAGLRQAALTVGEYDAEFLRILSRIDDMSDTDQLLAYQAGLRRNIRDRLIGHVNTVDEAMQMALRIEQGLATDRARHGFARPFYNAPFQHRATAPANTSSNTGPAPMELGNLRATTTTTPTPMRSLIRSSLCRINHVDTASAVHREQQRLYNEQRCFNCHQRGHVKRDCPNARQSKNE